MYIGKWGFSGSSVGKEFACNEGERSSISGSGRSPGEGIGYPLQYPWASLVAQTVKNPLTNWETWVRSLGWEGNSYPSSILAWRIPWRENSWQAPVHGVAKSPTRLSDFYFTSHRQINLNNK